MIPALPRTHGRVAAGSRCSAVGCRVQRVQAAPRAFVACRKPCSRGLAFFNRGREAHIASARAGQATWALRRVAEAVAMSPSERAQIPGRFHGRCGRCGNTCARARGVGLSRSSRASRWHDACSGGWPERAGGTTSQMLGRLPQSLRVSRFPDHETERNGFTRESIRQRHTQSCMRTLSELR